MWWMSEILRHALEGVRAFDAEQTRSQSVYGVDALKEVALHHVLAEALSAAGFGVVREAVYPGEMAAGVRRSARARCDLVLLPEPGQALEDPAHEQSVLSAGADTLFAGVADRMGPVPGMVPASEACWIEVKAVAQHAFIDGVPVPNPAYAEQLRRGPLTDMVKLARDPSIWTGAALVVLFCENEDIARHDLGRVGHALLDADLPLASPEFGGVAIDDRAGNAWCGMGLYPVRT
jgi:hypothetical protein